MKNPTTWKRKEWVERKEEYKKFVLKKAENKRLFQKQSFFGEGERVGRYLALIARANAPVSVILAICNEDGEIRRGTPEIIEVFKNYYQNLYSSTPKSNAEEMETFLAGLQIPRLSGEDMEGLEAPKGDCGHGRPKGLRAGRPADRNI